MILALMKLRFSYTEALGLREDEAYLYLDAWQELNNPEPKTIVRKKKKA